LKKKRRNWLYTDYLLLFMAELLEVTDLETHFPTREGIVKAVNGVSFSIAEGELLGLVGESGCGKSITALSIMGLVSHPGKIVGGSIMFNGRELREASDDEMRELRGNDIAMIFQDPMTSLNPVYKVGEQIAEALRLHRNLSRTDAWDAAIDSMREVAIPSPERRVNDYPHQLSGGMRQRVMIAMALACDPELLIADEPTTALDVTIQAQILELLNELRTSRKLSVLLITHDLGVVAETADRVCVMYTGKIVEEAPVLDIFEDPKHPYTKGLLNSVPKLSDAGTGKATRLSTIEGVVPSPTELPPGCHFEPRCSVSLEACSKTEIDLLEIGDGQKVRCILYEDGRAETVD
jgi:oligopeptide/dipeptide ABC transporter ATP-binding protein